MNDTESLLGYLRGVGSLSAPQLEYLRERGFLPGRAVAPGEEEPPEWDDHDPFDHGDDEDQTEQATPTRRKRGGGGKRSARGAHLVAEVLAERIEERLREQSGVMEGMAGLVCRPGEARPDWREVPRRLRSQGPEQLAVSLRSALVDRDVSVEQVWNFLALDDHRAVGRDEAGPAPQAFRALLAAAGAGQEEPPIKYAWLLREPAVAAVYDLLVGQGRVLQAAGLVHGADPEALREGLRKKPHRLAFWVLLLLFNIDFNEGKLGKASGQLMPAPGPPEGELWARAWAQALRMDSARVLPFLALYHAPGTAPVALHCPVRWATLAYRFSS